MAVENEGEPIRVSVSVGAADFAVGDEMGSWLERADRALYLAKEQGRDRFALLDNDGNPVSKSA
jgi:PleD family two-component response regulator